MNLDVLGRHSKQYIASIRTWGRFLLATEGTIWTDGTVTLMCKDGAICNHYRPTPQELRRAYDRI